MKRAWLLALLLAAAPSWLLANVAFAAAVPETPVVLRYGFKQGAPLKYRTEVTQHLVVKNTKGALGNLDVTSTYALDLVQKVTAIAPGHEYDLSVSPENVQIKLDGPMSKSATQIAEMLRKVAYVMKVDWRGQVKSLQESEGTPDAAKKMVASLKTALGQLMPMLPEGPQLPGGRWRQEMALPVDLPTGDKLQSKLTVDYVLRGWAVVDGRTCADVRMRLHLGLAGAMGQGPARVSVIGEGGGQGYAYIDLREGTLVGTGVKLVTHSVFKSDTIDVQQSSDLSMRTTLRK